MTEQQEKLEEKVVRLISDNRNSILIRGYTIDHIKEMIRIGKALPCCEELEDVLYSHYFDSVKPYQQENYRSDD